MNKYVTRVIYIFICMTVMLIGCAKPALVIATPEATQPLLTPTIPAEAPTTPTLTETVTVVPSVTPAATASIDLKITGLLEKEIGWSITELHAMPATNAGGKNNSGQAQTYSGVLVSDLIKLAAPKPEAMTLVFLDSSGTAVEVQLADTLTCTNCIVTFRNQGGLSLLLPFYSEQLALKGLVVIQVK